ncbi:MAG TPA: hypothetical protein VFH63_03270, partial [candidate division Zixibacteria bacterium]|nr:hypothetical protein [candidate division Zixibacteria bacterium]
MIVLGTPRPGERRRSWRVPSSPVDVATTERIGCLQHLVGHDAPTAATTQPSMPEVPTMRYKAMPVSVKGESPTRAPEGDIQRAASRAPRRPLFDWLLTLPLILLVPALVVPMLVTGAASPSLQIEGAALPGGVIRLIGRDFPTGIRVGFHWDGERVPWLDTVGTGWRGRFEERVRLPEDLAPGQHRIDAFIREGRTVGAQLAVVTVRVEDRQVAAATPDPTVQPTPRPTVTPTLRPTPSEEPRETLAATPAPTAASTPAPRQLTAANGPVVGYGRRTTGGAGGATIVVSNLNDSGPGSLRAALTAEGRRIVVFDVAGTISLNGEIMVKDPFVTVAGETAPGPVTLKGGGIKVNASEVILRHLRIRPGDENGDPATLDAVTINGMSGTVSNVVLDHLTMLWGPDIGGLAILGDV